MTKSIKVLTIISILAFSASFCTFSATASWCEHEGSTLVISNQSYLKVDDVKHMITSTAIRKCSKCLQNCVTIEDSYEHHYKNSTTDGGHGVGQIHYYNELCICHFSQIVSFTCYGPPCVTFSSAISMMNEGSLNEENLPEYGHSEQKHVESVIHELFYKKLLTLRMETVDYNEIFTDVGISDSNYFQDKLSYQQSLYAFSGRIPESHQLGIEIVSCSLNEDTATAKVMETIKFRYMSSNESSFERIRYSFELTKNEDGRWLISKVQSSDEFDGMYYESGFDLKSLHADILTAASIRDAAVESALLEDDAVDSVALPYTGQPK